MQQTKFPYSKRLKPQIDPLDDISKQAKRRSRNRSFAAFFLTGLILFIAFGIQGVAPFGDKHMVTVDLYHQYAPFLGELRTKLIDGESLFFSWSGGLGVNFYALFAYYLASPLNLISIFFPASALSNMVLVLVLLKVSLAAYAFRHFLKEYFHRDGPLTVGFAIAYGLSGYTMAYFFNIMWLDTLYLLPFLALSMLYLIRRNIFSPYIFTLALTLISNFYSGFFACFFMLFFFLVISEREDYKRAKDFFQDFFKLGLATILGIGLSFVTLLPTYKAMELTSAVGDTFPDSVQMMAPSIDFISRLLPLSSISIRRGMANIFVGTFAIILIFAFFRSKLNSPRRKIVNFALLVFLIISLNNNLLNFIWHGFHYPNQLPFRNSFVLVFFLLVLAYDGLSHLKAVKEDSLWSFALLVALLLLVLRKIDGENYPALTVLVGITFILAYTACFVSYSWRPRRAKAQSPASRRRHLEIIAFIILALMLNEITLNTFVSIHRVQSAEYFGSQDEYAKGREVDAIRDLVDHYQQMSQPDLVRMEVLPDKSVNDAFLYQTNGFTIFSSTFSQHVVKKMSNLGFPNNGINSFQYNGSTPVMNSLFGIKYVIHRQESAIYDHNQAEVYNQDGISVLENPYALPVVFLASPQKLAFSPTYEGPQSLGEYPTDSNNPFQAQSDLFYGLIGIDNGTIFKDQEINEVRNKRQNLDLTFDGESYRISRNGEYDSNLSFAVQIEEPGNYYLAWRVTGSTRLDEASLLIQESNSYERLGRKARSIAELGYHEPGEEIEIKFDFKGEEGKNKTGNLSVYVVRLNDPEFMRGMSALDQSDLQILKHDSRSIDLETSSDEHKMLFFSSGFDPGWTCYIDGEVSEIRIIDNAFMGVDLSPGKHSVRFEYTPLGFSAAWKISILALLATVILAVLDLRAYKAELKAERNKGDLKISANNNLPSKTEKLPSDDGWPVIISREPADDQ